MKKFIKRVYEVYRPFRFAMLGVFGFVIVSQVLNLSGPYFFGKILDGLSHKRPLKDLFALAAVTLVITVLRSSLLQYWKDRYELSKIDFAIPEYMQRFTLQRLFGFSIGQHTSENSGVKLSVISRGQNALSNLVDTILYQVLPLIAEAVILTCVLSYWSPIMGLVTFVGLVGYVALAISLNNTYRPESKKLETMYIRDSRFQSETMRNVGLVMATAQEDRALRECQESLKNVNNFSRNLWTRFVRVAALRNVLMPVCMCVILLIGIYSVSKGRYSIGQLSMFLSWSTNALGGISMVSILHRKLLQSYTSVKKYFDMLDIEPDVKVLPNPVKPEKFIGRIEFKNVTFRYRGRDENGPMTDDKEEERHEEQTDVGPALDNVNFVIEPGETVAIVGESGAGKSTMVHALIRAQDPDVGQVIIDGNDLRVLDLKHFRESIGIVNQDVTLFDHTLRYNITYGLNGRGAAVTDHELHAIAEMSCINRFFNRLEKGFDTFIGERGIKLSGGERQRVGIARALIKNPDILIFDEATSNLDSENESLIRESIEGRTTIIIAHRFSTIRNVDRVIVLDKGQVVGQGKHEYLELHCEPYQRLLQNQCL